MKKYYVANFKSALQEYTPNLPEDSELGLTDWTVYIILPVGGGITTLILALLVYFKCKSCKKNCKGKSQKYHFTCQQW